MTETTMHEDAPTTLRDGLRYLLGLMAFLIIAGLAIGGVMWGASRFAEALTPSWVNRNFAEGSMIDMLWLILIFAVPTVVAMLLLKARMSAAATVTMLAAAVGTFWYMGAMICAMDIEGSRNPYVRARDAYPRSYDSLAVHSKDPGVAKLIGKARMDGRITQGEAYDILHSPQYDAAWVAAARLETARSRRAVLSAG